MRITANNSPDLLTREHLEAMSRPVNIHVLPKDLDTREYLERIARQHLMTDHVLNSSEWLVLAVQAEKDGQSEIARCFMMESMIMEGLEANTTPETSPSGPASSSE